jgi:hypothetical protein
MKLELRQHDIHYINIYEKTVVAQNKSNLVLKNHFYNAITLQLIQKWFNWHLIKMENYVQQNQGTSLIKRGSLTGLASYAN